MNNKIGHYAFILGLVLVIVLGLAKPQLGMAERWVHSVIVLLGVVVGLLNIVKREAKDFLLVVAVLVLVAYVGHGLDVLLRVEYLGVYLNNILSSLMVFLIPAAVVVGVRQLWMMGQND